MKPLNETNPALRDPQTRRTLLERNAFDSAALEGVRGLVTCVDRATRCILMFYLGFGVVWDRAWEALQQVVDDAPPAHRYFSDGFPTYAQLIYTDVSGCPCRCAWQEPGVQCGRRQCGVAPLFGPVGAKKPLHLGVAFGRCIWALQRAVALFVYAWNRRQQFKRAFPKLPAHVCNFVTDLI